MKKAQLSPMSKLEVLDLVKTVLNSRQDKFAKQTIKSGFERLGVKDPVDETSRMSCLIEQLSSIQQRKAE